MLKSKELTKLVEVKTNSFISILNYCSLIKRMESREVKSDNMAVVHVRSSTNGKIMLTDVSPKQGVE